MLKDSPPYSGLTDTQEGKAALCALPNAVQVCVMRVCHDGVERVGLGSAGGKRHILY